MANPYYIPRKSVLERILPMAQLGLQAYGIQQGIKTDEAKIAAEQARAGLAERESIARYGQDVPVELGGPQDTGMRPALNLPGGRTGTMAHIPGLEQRKEFRERRKMGFLESKGLREERDPLIVHDRYMSEMPDKERLAGFGTRIPALSGYTTELIEGMDSGNIKDRWTGYHFIKDRIPQIKQSLNAEIARMKKSGQDTTALEEFRSLAKQGTFAEQLFQFPAERMPKAEKAPSFATTEEGVRLKAKLAKGKPTKPRHTAKAVLDMVEKINKEGRPPNKNEMVALGEMTKDMPIRVRDKITKQAKQKGLFGIDLLWPDVEEEGELVIEPRGAEGGQLESYGASDQPDGTVARNPKTGARIVTQNGEWVLAQE